MRNRAHVPHVPKCRGCGTTENLAIDRSNSNGRRSVCYDCSKVECVNRRERYKSRNGGAVSRAPTTAIRPGTQDIKRKPVSINEDVVTCVSSTIRTIEDLLKAINLDKRSMDRAGKTEWVVDDWTANKWDQGVVIEGVHRVVELWQVKAMLRRRVAVPIACEPVKPLTFTLKLTSKTAIEPASRLRRALIVPDSQHGFKWTDDGRLDPLHDRAAWAAMVEVARYAKPNRIILLGDMLDLPDWSDHFVSGPEFEKTTQPAMVELAVNLAQLRDTLVPYGREPVQFDWIEGNHEARMTRALKVHLRGCYGLRQVTDLSGPPVASVPHMMNLRALGITWHANYPSGHIWLNPNLYVHHGEKARGESGDTVKHVVRDARYSEIFGHIHRLEWATKTVHPYGGAVSYLAFCPGTVARIDGAVPAAVSRVNWQQGFALVDYESGNGMFKIDPVPIHNGSAIYDGRVFRGRFSMKALREATPDYRWPLAA